MSLPSEGRMLREMAGWHPGRDSAWNTRDRVQFEVVTSAGRAAVMEVRLRRDVVEVWLGEHCCGVLDRDRFRAWLIALPRTAMAVDDVTFSVDRMVDRVGRVAVSVPGVLAWTLSPMEFDRLVGRI